MSGFVHYTVVLVASSLFGSCQSATISRFPALVHIGNELMHALKALLVTVTATEVHDVVLKTILNLKTVDDGFAPRMSIDEEPAAKRIICRSVSIKHQRYAYEQMQSGNPASQDILSYA